MNNINKLKQELRLSFRDLEKYCDISASGITLLSQEKRPFRQSHIDSLTSFFNVTSDYLLGKSDKGYIVFLENDSQPLVLSESEYLSAKPNIKLSIIRVGNINFDVSTQNNSWQIYVPEYTVHRELKGDITNYSFSIHLKL